MKMYNSPIEPLAKAYYDAMHNQFDKVEYFSRDWEKYNDWKVKNFDPLTREEKLELYNKERDSGIPMGPEDIHIKKIKNPDVSEVTVYAMFPQMWGSTALGFGGIGGAAMTTEYTIVLNCYSTFAVYYGGQFAYIVKNPTQTFFDDINRQSISDVKHKEKYND
jgi:hypothetical protein